MAALEQQRCGICELELDEPRTLRCGHSFCGDCLEMRRHKLRDECWWCPACGERTGELFGASNDVDNRLGETRLHALAARAPGGVPATFERCVAAGLAVDGRRADGATPLFLAAYLGHVAEVVELLRLRADPNARAWGWGWPESFGFFAADDAERARRRNALAAPGGLTPLGIAVAQGRPGASDGAVTALLLCGARLAADDDCDEEDAVVGAFLAEDAREALRDDAAAVAVLGFDPRGPARRRGGDAYQALLEALERDAVAAVAARHPGWAGAGERALAAEVFRGLAADPRGLLDAFRDAGVVFADGAPWTEGVAWTNLARFLDGGAARQTLGDARQLAARLLCDLFRAGDSEDAGADALARSDAVAAEAGLPAATDADDVATRVRAFLATLEGRALGLARRATRLDDGDGGGGGPADARVRAAKVEWAARLDANAAALPPRAVAKLRRRLDHCASLAQVRAVVAVIADTLDPSDSESDADEARDEAGYRPD